MNLPVVTLEPGSAGVSMCASDIAPSSEPRVLLVGDGATPIFIRSNTKYRVYRRYDRGILTFVDVVPQ